MPAHAIPTVPTSGPPFTGHACHLLRAAEFSAQELGAPSIRLNDLVAAFQLIPAPHAVTLRKLRGKASDRLCPLDSDAAIRGWDGAIPFPGHPYSMEPARLLLEAARLARACGRSLVRTGDILAALLDHPSAGDGLRGDAGLAVGEGKHLVLACPTETGGEAEAPGWH